MIILDTNVVSEPMRPRPDARVLAWLDSQPAESLFLTSITVAELWAGIELLPAGKRRTQLHAWVNERVLPMFGGRTLPFDTECAVVFGAVHARARAAGKSVEFSDCALAAIAAHHGFSVATRNLRDFEGTGVDTLDPWSDAA